MAFCLLSATGVRAGGPAETCVPDGYFNAIQMPHLVHALAAADFDGDGYDDLCVPLFFVDRVVVYYGGPDAPFERSTEFGCLHYGEYIEAEDLNGDGFPDIVVGGAGGGLQVFLGNGPQMGFELTGQLNVSCNALALTALPTESLIATADYDVVTVLATSDGQTARWVSNLALPGRVTDMIFVTVENHPDRRLVVTVDDPPVAVAFQQVGGTFVESARFDLGGHPISVSGQVLPGRSVVAIACQADEVALLNIDALSGQMTLDRHSVASSPTSIVVGDLLGTGEPQLCVVCADESAGFRHGLKILPLSGADSESIYPVGSVVPRSRSVLLDAGGSPKVAILNPDARAVTIVGGRTGSGHPNGVIMSAGESSIWFCELMDMTGDGHADLVCTSSTSGVYCFLGDGAGGFSAGVLTGAVGMAGPFIVRDMNGDVRPDVFVVDVNQHRVYMLENLGSGRFRVARSYAPDFGARHLEVLEDSVGGVSLCIATYRSIDILSLGQSGEVVASQRWPGLSDASMLRAVDLDVDGYVDLVEFSGRVKAVQILWGKPGGGFEPDSVATGAEKGAYPGGIGDLDGNGLPDLLQGLWEPVNAVFVFETLYQVSPRVFVRVASQSLRGIENFRLVDCDSDGALEYVALDTEAHLIEMGSASTEEGRVLVGTGYRPGAMALGDVNHDGTIDYVVALEGFQILTHLTPGPTPVEECALEAGWEDGGVLLEWSGVAPGSVVRLRRRSGDGWTDLARIASSQRQYRDYAPTGGVGGEYEMTVRDRLDRLVCMRTAFVGVPEVRPGWLTAFHVVPTGRDRGYKIQIGTARPATCTVTICDVQGRVRARLFSGEISGNWETEWNPGGPNARAPSGINFVVLKSGEEVVTRRVLVR